MNKLFLSSLAFLSIVLFSCSEAKKDKSKAGESIEKETLEIVDNTGDEEVNNHNSFLGVWGTESPIIIADGGEDGYYIYFGEETEFIKADIGANTIEGTNFSGKFMIRLISAVPPQFLYSNNGSGDFEPIVDRLYNKKVDNNASLLIGKWQSTDDDKSIVEYTTNDVIDYYDDEFLSREPYTLSPRCMNSSDLDRSISSAHDYISVIESDLCWYIISLDKNNLSLSYTAHGNTLNYERVK